MKKTLSILIVLTLFISCGKEEIPPTDKGKPDPNAMILIKPGKQTKTTFTGLSNRQIVEDAFAIRYTSHYSGNVYYDDAKEIGRAFNEDMKDVEKLELKMLGIDVITAEGDYYRDLTYAYDVYLTTRDNDTIGYVPDNVIKDARTAIEAAWEDQDYNTIYQLFNTAFIFLPIEE